MPYCVIVFSQHYIFLLRSCPLCPIYFISIQISQWVVVLVRALLCSAKSTLFTHHLHPAPHAHLSSPVQHLCSSKINEWITVPSSSLVLAFRYCPVERNCSWLNLSNFTLIKDIPSSEVNSRLYLPKEVSSPRCCLCLMSGTVLATIAIQPLFYLWQTADQRMEFVNLGSLWRAVQMYIISEQIMATYS